MACAVRRVSTVLLSDASETSVALFLRSDRVSTYRGHWAGVSGSVEAGETPEQCAWRELSEETTLAAPDVALRRCGRPLRAPSSRPGVVFEVHPFLFAARSGLADLKPKIHIDWEHTEWKPSRTDIRSMQCVPRLYETWERVHLDPAARDAVAAIESDLVGGACSIALRAASSLLSLCPSGTPETVIDSVAWHLTRARPSMCSVANAVALAREAMRSGSGATTAALEALSSAPAAVACRWRGALASAPKHIVTLSRSSTVLLAITEAAAAGHLSCVHVLESRTACEGRDFAAELASRGLAVQLLPDCAAASLLERLALECAEPGAVCALVGADAVFGDGSFANKTGTLSLALACAHARVPLVVVFDTLKVSPSARPQRQTWEDGGGADLWDVAAEAPGAQIPVWNPLFEHELKKWLLDCIGLKIESVCDLADGVALCRVANKVVPGCVSRFSEKPATLFARLENIALFLRAAAAMGVTDIFDALDLAQQKNLPRVVGGLALFGALVSSAYPEMALQWPRDVKPEQPFSQEELDGATKILMASPQDARWT
eukprot:m51a1_g1193 hypothetical protein (549) ;mRNA; r:432987-436577